ncbi:MAG TPA: hypothetical protein ENN09_01135 [Planctomycetes bacterium]|nr:hypothetical protein [Planctomycetota bacterium]
MAGDARKFFAWPAPAIFAFGALVYLLSGGVTALAAIFSGEGVFWLLACSAAWFLTYRSGGLRIPILLAAACVAGFIVAAMAAGAFWLVSGLFTLAAVSAVYLAAARFWGWLVFHRMRLPAAIECLLGLGTFGTLLFIVGIAGLFHPLILALAVLFSAVGGVLVTIKHRRAAAQEPPPPPASTHDRVAVSGMFAAASFAALFIVLYALLPHVHGAQDDYDALEYHLQLPREYLEARRVKVLPHNLFSALPQLAEMLYAPAMVLGGAIGKLLPSGEPFMRYGAQVGARAVNVVFVLLAAAVLLEEGRRRHGASPWGYGAAAALFMPLWTVVLAGGAVMVEVPLAAFGLAAFILLLHWLEEPDDRPAETSPYPLACAAVSAGLAAAVKYSGWLFFVLPLAAVVTAFSIKKRSIRPFAAAAAFGALPLIPWLAYSHVSTGNPFHPMFLSFFDERALSSVTALRWQLGIAPQTGILDAVARTAGAFAGGWPDGVRIGPYGLVSLLVAVVVLTAGICPAAASRRTSGETPFAARRFMWLLPAVLAWGAVSWLLFTNRLERFLYPVLALSALAWLDIPSALDRLGNTRRWICLAVACLLLSTPANMSAASAGRSVWAAPRCKSPLEYVLRINPAFELFEAAARETGTMLLLGEAQVFHARSPLLYSTPFDRSPLADILASADDLSSDAVSAEKDVAAAIRRAGVALIHLDTGELLRTKRRYRPHEKPLIPDVTEAQERAFFGLLSSSWETVAEYVYPSGQAAALYRAVDADATRRR